MLDSLDLQSSQKWWQSSYQFILYVQALLWDCNFTAKKNEQVYTTTVILESEECMRNSVSFYGHQ